MARVHYRVDSGHIFGFRSGSPKIRLQVKSDQCSELRNVVVVGLPNRLPTRIDDGEIVLEAAIITFEDGYAEVPIQVANLAAPLYVKLFLKNPDDYPGVRLMAASKDRLLLKC